MKSSAMEVVQDSEEEQPNTTKTPNVEDAENHDGDGAADTNAAGNEEEEEEEYEIEAILKAKHGRFPGGRVGYLVKWKGYDESHNSWVDQEDAINATLLIDEFWKKQNKDKKGRPKSNILRKSVSQDDSPEDKSSNKRKKSISSGRKSKSSQPDVDDEDDEEEKPKTKRSKKTQRAKDPTEDMNMEDDDTQYRPMQKFKDKKSWENLVDRVDTIEKVEGTLKVFFTLNNGDKVVESSQECARHFPQKLIQFYESNLRWRESEN